MMLFSRSRNRGFTITAALIFAALLTLIAAAVQATVPAVTSPTSMSAATAVSQTIQATAPIRPGFDQMLFFSGTEIRIRYYPVCEPKPKGTTQTFPFNVAGVKIGAELRPAGSLFAIPTKDRCEQDAEKPKLWYAKPGAWSQWTLYCQIKNEDLFRSISTNIQDVQISDLQTMNMASEIKPSPFDCRIYAPGETIPQPSPVSIATPGSTPITQPPAPDVQSPSTNVPSVTGLQTPTNNPGGALLGQAYETQVQIDTVTQQIRTLENREYEISRELSQLATCTEFPGTSDTCLQDKDTEQIKKLQNEKQASEALRNQYLAQLQLLQNRSVILSGNPNLGTILNPGGGTSLSQNGGTPRIPMPTFPNLGTSNFSNPALGANNIPISPFGGSCATRYICSGGVLYYQSANSYGSYGYSGAQCQTQVVQRCAYGCASINGSNSTADGLGGIMSVIGGLFGGNSSATTNTSNSCAYSSQNAQSQNQFGLGNLVKLLFGGDDEGSQSQTCPRAPAQPDASQCTSGSWRPTSSQSGCTTGWQCVSSTGGSASNPNPTAQLSCTPQVVESGSQVKLNYTCGNSTASKGTGFDTGGALSGTATAVASPPDGENIATYTLTCLNQGITTSAQCQVQINKSQIILVTNPSRVASGETSLIGWVTSGMKSCTVSSLEQQDFTTRNVGNTSVNGAASTSPITGLTHFQLDCQTHSGTIKTAATTVNLK